MKRSASSAQALILASDESRLARQASDSTSPREREMKRSASSAQALKLASDERRAAMPTTPTRESLHWLDDAALPKKNNSRAIVSHVAMLVVWPSSPCRPSKGTESEQE